MIVPSYKPAFTYGGPIQSIAALCESLTRIGHEVDVFTTTANGSVELDVEPGKLYSIDGVNVRYYKRLTKGNSHLSPSLFKALSKTGKQYDVVHINSWWNYVAVGSLIICKLKKFKTVLSPRGSLSNYTVSRPGQFTKRLFQRFIGIHLLKDTVFHTTSSKEAKELEAFSPGAKPVIISNILDLPAVLNCNKETTNALQLLFLGRIDPSKNLEWLISMLKDLRDVDFILRIAGEGPDTYVNQLKRMTKDDIRFSWVGFVDGDEKYKLLCQADVLMLPSHTENFGNVVFEALCQGTAVMTSSTVGAKDYLIENNLGWVVDLSAPLWAETITSISQSKTELQRIKSQAPELIKSDFDPVKMAGQYIDLYKKVYMNEVL